MDNVDPNKLRQIVEKESVVAIHRQHGDLGTASFRALALALKTIFNYIEPESFGAIIVVFKTLDDSSRPIDETTAKTVVNPANLKQEVVGNTVIQVLSDGRLLLWTGLETRAQTLAKEAVVYRYQSRREYFLAGSTETEVAKVGQYASIYSVPAFSDLRLALERYRSDRAKETSCPILQAAWTNEKQLLFVQGPEDFMRNSLVDFLKISLRDAETRPEQNMGVSYPVDIKVTFNFSNRLALIEIKWLGSSVKLNGKLVSHYDGRARSGAKQLADYLVKNRKQAPTHIMRGYLVVFDGRRRRIKKNTKSINSEDGGYYRHREIKFDLKYDDELEDFETPIRMFMEPVTEP
ncbi:MAG: hypothetical protein AABN33_19600 [Acidobacteriota bacterium]